jgi:hypothetical protein
MPVVLTAVLSFLCIRVFTGDTKRTTLSVADMYQDDDGRHSAKEAEEVGNTLSDDVLDTRVRIISVALLVGIFAIYVLGLVSRYGI